MNIAKLVNKSKKGNNKAFDELYKLSEKEIWFTCLSLLKNETTAQDIMQDTYLTAFLKIKSLEDEEQFIGWIRKIAANKCKDYLRKKGEIPLDEEYYANTAVTDELMIPEEYITNEEKRKKLLALMEEALSYVQYHAVLMYYFDEMSIAEIAEIAEVSEGTIKSRLNSARAKMKTAIEDYEKRSGDKLHGAICVPLFGSIFKEEAKYISVPNIKLNLPTVNGVTANSANIFEKAFKAVMATTKARAIAITCCATLVIGGAGAFLIVNGFNKELPVSTSTDETILVEETIAEEKVNEIQQASLSVDDEGNIVDSKGNKIEPNEKGEVEIATEDGKKVKISADEVEAVNNGSNVVVTTAPKPVNNSNSNKGNSSAGNSNTNKGSSTSNKGNTSSNGGSSSKPVQKPVRKPTQKPTDPHAGKTYHEAVTKKVWVEPEYKTVHHPAVTKKVNHQAETRQVWVDPVTHEEPVYKWVGYDVCNQCGARLNDVNELMDHFFDSDTCVSYKTCKEKVQTGTTTVVDKEGYYKTETVKDAWTETVTVKEAWTEKVLVKEGYYKTVVVREAGWY